MLKIVHGFLATILVIEPVLLAVPPSMVEAASPAESQTAPQTTTLPNPTTVDPPAATVPPLSRPAAERALSPEQPTSKRVSVPTAQTLQDANTWEWVGGSNSDHQPGVYGSKGVAASTNIPGGRMGALSWTDSGGNFWLFGGHGYDSTETGDGSGEGELNDLWKYAGGNWTWVGGSNIKDQSGIYGTQGVAASANMPGARENAAISQLDPEGNVWLFGGYGYDINGNWAWLNDLWKFDGVHWIWVSGSNAINAPDNYGTKGVTASTNMPGARRGSNLRADHAGNIWLYGGSNGNFLGDLWKFDGENWTWIAGSNTPNYPGGWGDNGPGPGSIGTPSSREDGSTWIDADDNLWLFGGIGINYDAYNNTTTIDPKNDLWKFDGTDWIYITSGASLI